MSLVAAIDATPLTTSSGGVRRYTEQLVQALRCHYPDDEYHLITDQPLHGQAPDLGPIDRRWWTVGVQKQMRQLGCGVFHGTEFSVPYLPLKPAVMTVHDLSPWRDPAWHSEAARVRTRTPWLLRLRLATMVITPTEAIREELHERFGYPLGRITAVHHGVDERFRPSKPPEHARYFLFVGTIEPRKNVPVLLQAWRRVRQTHAVDLLVVGRRRADAPTIEEEPGLTMLGEVPDSDLPDLYSGAIACVYPSQYEGFGLPVLEAMSCGCPVITSLDPALQEVSGGAGVHVDTRTPDALEDAMKRVLDSPEYRAQLAHRSLERSRQFTWQNTARLTREVYVEAIERHGR